MSVADVSDAMTLPESLVNRTNDELQRMARLFTAKTPTNKRDLVGLLIAQTHLPALQRTLELAGEDGRRLLAVAAHGNGLLRTAQACVRDFPLGSWQRDWNYSRAGQQKPSVVLLFFPDEQVMPRTLRTRLAGQLPAPPRPPLPTLDGEPPGFAISSDVLVDLGLLLESARAGQVQMTLKGPSVVSLRRVAAGLTCPSPHAEADQLRLRCLATLLTACGWLRQQGSLLRTAHAAIDRAGLQDLFARYKAWPHDELLDLDGLRHCHDEYAPISEPVARRRALLEVLRGCPRGVWIDSGAFSRHAAAQALIDPILDEKCQVSIGNAYHGSMSALGEPGLIAVRDAWVRLVLGCYLAPLGVVEVSLDRLAPLPAINDDYDDGVPDRISHADRVAAFRLTPLGVWLLGLGPEPAHVEAQPGGWRIQADGSVVALGERIAPADRVLLDKLGERLDERTWRLDRDRLIAAIAAGDGPQVWRDRLASLAGIALPVTVGRLIDEATRRATAITLGLPLILLTVTDPHAREQLLHDRTTRELCCDCGGNSVGVSPSRLADLRRAARKLGWHIPVHHGS